MNILLYMGITALILMQFIIIYEIHLDGKRARYSYLPATKT
jgi:hypothetical protein